MRTKSLLLVALCAAGLATFADGPKNVILFIGDGMSVPQRMTADEFARKSGAHELALNRLPHQALTRTCSASSLVTDSAAAATAIACGVKTYNGALGVDATSNRVFSCAVAAKKSGRKVGIVTSVTINHATPGGFYAHRRNRSDGYGIGLDLLESGFDYFAGGGCSDHGNKKHSDYNGDIYDLASKAGYYLAKYDRKLFDALKSGDGKVWYVAKESALPFAIDAGEWKDVPTLAEMTAKGLELLDNEKGFFMMVEGGKVDWAGHANDAATNLREVLALDDAVRVALDWQREHPDTLIVVTGDHETGGMAMGFAGTGYAFHMDLLANQTCSVEAFVRKVRSQKPADFDAAKDLLAQSFGFVFGPKAKDSPMGLSGQEVQALKESFAKNDPARLAEVAKVTMSHKCGIGWSSGAHTAQPVLTTAGGPGAERFSGYIENTDISRILKDLMR